MDRRKKYTQQEIQRAFIKELRTKHISQITIKGICDEAQINRSTFYRNYVDIYDLFEQMERQLTAESFDDDDLDKARYRLIHTIYQHQVFYREFLAVGLKSSYIEQVEGRLKEQVKRKLKAQVKYDEESFELEYQYNYYGVLGVIKVWLDKGCPSSPDEFARKLFSIVDRQYGR